MYNLTHDNVQTNAIWLSNILNLVIKVASWSKSLLFALFFVIFIHFQKVKSRADFI